MNQLPIAFLTATAAALSLLAWHASETGGGNAADERTEPVARHVIAHRGASVERPENTLEAIERAIEIGVTGVEVDVRQTRDGHLVILHDATLDRTTDGSGNVRDKTLAEVRQLDAGSWFDEAYRGQRVPTLDEALEACRGRVDVLLDLKLSTDAFNQAVIERVRARGEPRRTIVGVRTVEQARQFRELLPEAWQLGFIPEPAKIEDFAQAGVEVIRLWSEWIAQDEQLVERVHRSGARLHVNTWAGSREELEPLLPHHPYSILTDDPARLLRTLEQLNVTDPRDHLSPRRSPG